MRYTYRVFYIDYLISSNKRSMLIRAKSVSEAERKFKEKFPKRKFLFVK